VLFYCFINGFLLKYIYIYIYICNYCIGLCSSSLTKGLVVLFLVGHEMFNAPRASASVDVD